jgi:alkylated DNA repair dioxygenase AlkB
MHQPECRKRFGAHAAKGNRFIAIVLVEQYLDPARDEKALITRIAELPFKEFAFHGFLGKRRTVSFGWHYDFNGGGLGKAAEIPEFLAPARALAAEFAGLRPEALEHALLIEYRPGAGIGWHRDRPQFGDVIGISLLAPCTFRLRRKQGTRWERSALVAQRRSAYLLRGKSRSIWEQSRLRKSAQDDKWIFPESGHAVPSESGETMSKRPRRNHTPAFKAKVSLSAIKGDRWLSQRPRRAALAQNVKTPLAYIAEGRHCIAN